MSVKQKYNLRSPEMRSSFNQLLVALSVIDSLYVITGIVDYSLVKVPELVIVSHLPHNH